MSDFIISMASEAARRTIQEFHSINLSARDQQTFAESLLNPKSVPKNLMRAKQRHDELLGPS